MTGTEYELTASDGSRVRVATELENGRFTIQAKEPLIKVAWRLVGLSQPSDEKEKR